jgi:hypothetical protein
MTLLVDVPDDDIVPAFSSLKKKMPRGGLY